MLRFILPIVLLVLPVAAQSDQSQKKINVGVGAYALVVANDSTALEDDQLSGYSISGQYAFSDIFAFRAAYYVLDHSDFRNVDADGYDAVLYIGSGLMTAGLKIYGGGGYYNESWETSGASESFSGLQLNGGLGYNWRNAGLDFILALRQTSDYEDVLVGSGISIDVAASASVIVSARF
jgi:hypothetical protein